MKIIITKKQSITSAKKGTEWVKLFFLSPKDGTTGNIFTSKEAFEKYKIDADSILDETKLKEISNGLSVYEAEFDQEGRLLDIQPE